MDIKKILDDLDLKSHACHFIDVRIERTQSSFVQFKNGDLIGAGEKPVSGAFIRMFHNGFWFYSSTTSLLSLDAEIKKLKIQATNSRPGSNHCQLPANNGVHHLINKKEAAFSSIPLEKKVEMGKRYLPLFKQVENLQDSTLMYTDLYKEKFYKSSVGTEFSYDFNQAEIYFGGTLKKGENLFDDAFRKFVLNFSEFEYLENAILNHFQEAQKFLDAKTITPGKYKVVLSPDTTGVFTHESFGHKSEADFMMGDPEAVKEWKIGSSVGSACLSIVDSGLHFDTSGHCPIDDEGTLAQKNYLIKEGTLAGRLHSNHTANVLNETATGNARALNFEFEPIVRMTSTYIEAGKTPLPELLKMAEGGIYIVDFKHGSGGSTFTIAPRRAYMIKDGKLAEPVKVSVLSGSVFETLKGIEACGDDFRLVNSAFGGCGKMEQSPLPVSMGGPSILVNEMLLS